MKINDLIEKLLAIQAENGNLDVVTPGFDESFIDDVETVELIDVERNTMLELSPFCGDHEQVDTPTETSVKAVFIDF